jgi:hypothetical protein
VRPPEDEARAALGRAAVDAAVAAELLAPAPDPQAHTMRLARAWLVMFATPRPGHEAPPPGFEPAWGGEAAVRVIALDRDRLGEPTPAVDLAALLVHPGPGPAPGWRTGP